MNTPHADTGVATLDESAADALTPPRIGNVWIGQGGIYAGIMAGRDGAPDYHLIVATPELGELKKVAWGKRGQDVPGAASYHDGRANTRAMLEAGYEIAVKFAALRIDGHADYYLPSHAEAHLMAANLKEQFEDAWFWTSSQYSAYYAWNQNFSDGYQDNSYKDDEGRARAVRLIQINP